MQRRERILLLAVGGLAAAAVGGWGAVKTVGTLQARQAELTRLESESGKRDELRVKLEDLMDRKLRLAQRSLLPDIEPAKSAYAQWLGQLVRDPAVSFSSVNVQAQREIADKAFTRLRFSLDAEATYPQFIHFLEKFYAADHLHKIIALQLPLGRDQKKLAIKMTIEALTHRNTENKEVLSKRSSPDHPAAELHADVAQLMLRHFYRANQPPKLALPSTYPATVGSSLRIPLGGTDPDDDKLTFKWISGPDWLKMEGNALVAQKVPEEKSYEVVLSVTDDGVPPLTIPQKFTIAAKLPPVPKTPKKPRPFDHLKFTFLEGLLERGDKPEAKITVRTLGNYHTLHVGDEVEIGGAKIKLVGIDLEARTIEVQLPDNSRRTVSLGKSLGEKPPR